MKKIWMVLSVFIIATVVFAACGQADEPIEVEETTTEEVAPQAGSTSSTEESPEQERMLAPDFVLTNKEGELISLEKYRGKIIFLNFFTTWCTYCDQEMPDFQEASGKYADDVEFLIVNSFTSDNVSKEEVYEWYESRGLTMEMVIDEEGILKELYPIQGFPTTFFIDREGYVIAYYPGVMSMDIVDQVVAEFK